MWVYCPAIPFLRSNMTCLQCSGAMPERRVRRNAVYCGDACARTAYQARYKEDNPARERPLSTGTAGALSELIVACDLMKRGFHVFRALSPSCECDLAILRDGSFRRVEVTTGYIYGPSGKVMVAPHKAERYDVLAIVLREGEIVYRPAF